MACSYTVSVPNLGVVEVNESSRSRRLSLKVRVDGRISVSSPHGVRPDVIINFVAEHADWARQHQAKFLAQGHAPIIFAPDVEFHTRTTSLRLSPSESSDRLRSRLQGSDLVVSYPPSIDVNAPQFQKFVRHVIDSMLRVEAFNVLPGRLESLARKFNLHYDHLAIRNMSSRWGSCSSSGRICLNVQLMRLPDHLIDMVILHELNHTVHMDHSKAFYADLDRMCDGRLGLLEREIKNFSTSY